MRERKKVAVTVFVKLVSSLSLCAALILPSFAAAQNDISDTDAIRFLQQASFGATAAEVANVQSLGYAGWINNQFTTPTSGWLSRDPFPGAIPGTCDAVCVRDNYRMYQVQKEFFTKALTQPDQLRQRVVFALDQIWVISDQLQGNFQANWMGYYLQVLDQFAFGNWRDLMQAVTLSPGMGKYLDMAGNRYVATRSANENYAREILQLFCVGLDELNEDGTRVLDVDGNRVPTYDQDVVVGFSKAFTGWVLAPIIDTGIPNWRDPMVHDGNPNTNHDPTDKLLLGGVVLPGAVGQIDQDLTFALDNIFNNRNVPPFISKQLIQKLVTSNPSPAYVNRVTQVFKDNGQGVRGDMQAVIMAILTDDEARNSTPAPEFGKLREPVLMITNLLRNFNIDGIQICSTTGNPCTDYVLGEQYNAMGRMDEDVFRSPTVFNFFPPDYPLAAYGLVGPEFAIQSTTTTLARINTLNQLVFTGNGTPGGDRPYGTRIDPANIAAVAYPLGTETDDDVVTNLGRIMTAGTVPGDIRNAVVTAISGIADPTMKAQEAAYLIATSSSYNVQR